MLQLEVIGNLGANAEVRSEAGRKFVCLSIASTRRRTDSEGRVTETTDWVSATINGDGGNLLPYLTKGTKVYAVGEPGLRLFHSEKDRKMKAGYNLYINRIELIQTNTDQVPRTLYDIEGNAKAVAKYYYCNEVENGQLFDRMGVAYNVANKWVSPAVQQQSGADAEQGSEAGSETKDEVY